MIEIDIVGLIGVTVMAALFGYIFGHKSSAERWIESVEYQMMKDECKALRKQINELQ